MATLGVTTPGVNQGSWSFGAGGNGVMFVGPYTATQNGTVTGISVYTNDDGGADWTFGIYEDSSGPSGAPIAVTAGGTIGGSAGVAGLRGPISISASILSGHSYWLAAQNGYGNSTAMWYDNPTSGDGVYQNTSFAYSSGSLPNPAGASQIFAAGFIAYHSFYITYTPGGGGGGSVDNLEWLRQQVHLEKLGIGIIDRLKMVGQFARRKSGLLVPAC